MNNCCSCTFYFDYWGVCCCPESEHRAEIIDEAHDAKTYSCESFKEGEFKL